MKTNNLLLFLIGIMSVICLSSCGGREEKRDWMVYECTRTLFHNQFSKPFDLPSTPKVVKNKTILEMLKMQADFSEQSNDSTLFYLDFAPRDEKEYSFSSKERNWVLTTHTYMIDLEYSTHEGLKEKTVLNKGEVSDTLSDMTEKEIYDIAKSNIYIKPGQCSISVCTVKEIE